jgi:hypothetical protein
MKIIPTRVHGILDYVTVATLLALPRLLAWSDRMVMVLTVIAVGTLAYSLLTRYELGAIKVLPMAGHLGLDFASGVLFLALALLLRDEPASVRGILAGIGAFEIGAVLLSQSATGPITGSNVQASRR